LASQAPSPTSPSSAFVRAPTIMPAPGPQASPSTQPTASRGRTVRERRESRRGGRCS
jgi:hypothetical protein